jgi:MFS family permease
VTAPSTSPERVTLVDLLRGEPRFRNLWFSQCVSEIGDWFQLVALVSMMPTSGLAVSSLAGLFVVRYVAMAALSPLAGVVADRYHRGWVMIVADLARAVIAYSFTLVRGPEDVALAYALSFALEGFATVFEPARGAATPQIVPPRALFAANTLGSATWSAMLAIGTVIGGLFTASMGRKAAFTINAASFVLSAVFVWRAKIPPLPQGHARAERPGPLRDLADGLAYLRDHPAQRAITFAKAGALLWGGIAVIVSVFADRLFRPTDVAISTGLMYGGRGLGAFVVPFVMARVFGEGPRGLVRSIRWAFPIAFVAFSFFALGLGVLPCAAALFVAHGATATVWVSSAQLLQMTVPNRVLGRVLSVELLLLTIALASSSGLAALLMGRVGLSPQRTGFVIAALLLPPFVYFTRVARSHVGALESAAGTEP